MVSPRLIGLTLAAALALPQSAAAWRAWNDHEVLPAAKGVFEVVAETGYGTAARDYWCAIGDFAIRQLGTQATRRIYIWQAEGPSVNRGRKKAVQFALVAPKGADTTPGYTLSTKRVGDNMTASQAQNYCYDQVEKRIWID